ncbi:MAG: hypothetical protein ACR2OG_04935 [Gemmatimonadaceae bacterium]
MLWLVCRFGLMLASMIVGRPELGIHPSTAIALIALTGGLSVLDQRRRGETAFFGNVGVSERAVALASAVPGAAAEMLIAVFVRR